MRPVPGGMKLYRRRVSHLCRRRIKEDVNAQGETGHEQEDRHEWERRQEQVTPTERVNGVYL